MATSYIVDGYNLLHAIGYTIEKAAHHGLERARGRLLDYLAAHQAKLSREVLVVFDSKQVPRRGVKEHSYKGLLVHFAADEDEADDFIEKEIARQALPERLVVVSSDHRIIKSAQRGQARAMTSAEFIDFLESPTRRGAENAADSEKDINLSDAERDAWVREFGSLEDQPEWKELFRPYTFGDAETDEE